MSKIEEFLKTQHSLSKTSIRNYRIAIRKFERLAKSKFEDAYLDKDKVHEVLNLISQENSDSSWNLYLVLYKRFARWLNDPEDEYTPRFWKKIKPKKIDWEKKLKNKWLTKKEFYKLLDVIDLPRDKALFGVAVEGALRVGEILQLRIRDVQRTSYGYDVTVSGKTGSSSFPVVLFAPLLTQWLNHHPFKNDPESPLWIRRREGNSNFKDNRLHEMGVYSLTKKYARRAGLRPISFHWLRHTKITWTAKNKKVRISDEMAKKMFRWSKNSNMFSRYTHLHGTDSKDSFLALAGVKTEQEEEGPTALDPKKCLNCGEVNSATMIYCGRCGTTLDEEESKRQVAKQRLIDEMIKAFQERSDKSKKVYHQ
ncbi:MAG: site-specific integrase [Candidatus Bathyarchaeota archaeon]|jgi:integrase|nr:site-specific integrase [Candidatus Bathyarchaeota archaeon]